MNAAVSSCTGLAELRHVCHWRLAYMHSCIFTIMNEFMFLSFPRRWESPAYSLRSSSQITQRVTAHGKEALLSTSDCKCGRQWIFLCSSCSTRRAHVWSSRAAALEFLRFNLKARKSENFTYRWEEQPEELWTAVRGRSGRSAGASEAVCVSHSTQLTGRR